MNKKMIPNQKVVTIHREPRSDPFTTLSIESMNNAARRMNGKSANGFMLWCYMATNADGFTFGLSNVAVNKAFGMSRDSYDAAVRILMKEGFLVHDQEQEKDCFFDFIEYPDAHKMGNTRCRKTLQHSCGEIPQHVVRKTLQETLQQDKQDNKHDIPDRDIDKQQQQPLVFLYEEGEDEENKGLLSWSSSQRKRKLPPERLFRLMKEELDKIGFKYQGRVRDVYGWLAHLVRVDGYDPVKIIEAAKEVVEYDRQSDREHKIINHVSYLMTTISTNDYYLDDD